MGQTVGWLEGRESRFLPLPLLINKKKKIAEQEKKRATSTISRQVFNRDQAGL